MYNGFNNKGNGRKPFNNRKPYTKSWEYSRKRKYQDDNVEDRQYQHSKRNRPESSYRPQPYAPRRGTGSFTQKLYSANDRLANIRSQLQDGGIRKNNGPIIPNKNTSNNPMPSLPSPSSCSGPLVVAKPSSIQDRLNTIRNSIIKTKTCDNNVKVIPPLPSHKPVRNFEIAFSNSSSLLNTQTDQINTLDDFNVPKQPSVDQAFSSHSSELNMDWSFIEERDLLSNLEKIRKDLSQVGGIEPKSKYQESVSKDLFQMPKNQTIFKNIYVVVDTNIFLSHLGLLKIIIADVAVNGVVKPIIYVPWMVIQELDYIKDDKLHTKLKRNAQTAINFLNNGLKNKNIRGQSVLEAYKQNIPSTRADDGILFCCLQIVEKNNRAMLLSNDTNLRNKAMLSGISTYSHNEILKALDPYKNYQCKSSASDTSRKTYKENQLKLLFSNLFTHIIQKQLEGAYGKIWTKMDILLQKSSWDLKECLKLFTKYWRAVFSMDLQKQFLSNIKNFQEFLNTNSDPLSDEDMKKICNFGLTACVYLQNEYVMYADIIKECIVSVQKFSQKLNTDL